MMVWPDCGSVASTAPVTVDFPGTRAVIRPTLSTDATVAFLMLKGGEKIPHKMAEQKCQRTTAGLTRLNFEANLKPI